MEKPMILIVEDDKIWMYMIEDMLSGKYALLFANSTDEAERLFLENQDKLTAIVMDGYVLDGYTIELVRRIRSNNTTPMIANSISDKTQQMLMEAGCNYRTNKAEIISLSQLLDKIVAIKPPP
ncbi:MAG: response regulator [bacterium]